MKQNAAKLHWSIILITVIFIPLLLAFAIACFWGNLPLTGIVLIGLLLYCFFHKPDSYEVRGDRLIVNFVAGSKEFGPIGSCQVIRNLMPIVWRICGIGGVFAFTGIYWNSKQGMHRRYVTHLKKCLMIKTDKGKKIIISPADPQKFADDVNEELGLNKNPTDEQAKNTAVNYNVIDRLSD